MDTKCTVEGCDRDIFVKKRGICSAHYRRFQRHGDPEAGSTFRFKSHDFDKLVDRSGGPDACWPWLGAVAKQGYGRWRPQGQNGYAHQEAWRRAVGEPPKQGSGRVLDHTCHDPAVCPGGETCPHRKCCNPAHLTLTTNAVNLSWERSARPRMGIQTGNPCIVEGCDRLGAEKGRCSGHAGRLRNHGDVFAHIPLGFNKLR